MIFACFRAILSLFYRPDLLQVAALCIRGEGKETELLLVHSLDSKRWIIPKGWPMRGKTLAEAAAIEAWEEAGVRGEILPEAIGSFAYQKRRASGVPQPCQAQVYCLRVTFTASSFPESELRNPQWFSLDEALERISEPDLKALIQKHILGSQ